MLYARWVDSVDLFIQCVSPCPSIFYSENQVGSGTLYNVVRLSLLTMTSPNQLCDVRVIICVF